MQIPASTLDWLLDGDVAVQYHIHRDLLGVDRREPEYKNIILQE